MQNLQELVKNDIAEDSDEVSGSDDENGESVIEIMAQTFGNPIQREKRHLTEKKLVQKLDDKKPRSKSIVQKKINKMQEKFSNIFASKNERERRKFLKPKKSKLPKNFSDLVLDEELKLDSGNFGIDNVNNLMKLYSLAVEYYSGMNDEKYIFFTERIQNTLVRPEILRLMGERDSEEKITTRKSEEKSPIAYKGDKDENERLLRSPEMVDIQKQRLEQQTQRKMERNQKLIENVQKVQIEDPQYVKDAEEIQQAKEVVEVTKRVIHEDVLSQKDSIAKRIAERKKRVAEKKYENRSVNNEVFKGNLTAKKGASVLIQNDGFGFGFGNNDSSKRSREEGQEVSVHLNNSTNQSSVNIDQQIKRLEHNPGMVLNPMTFAAKKKNQSIILQGSKPLFGTHNEAFSYNFDIQSKSSALNEEEIQQKIHQKIEDVWTTIETKQEALQKEYQNELEQIIEEVTVLKFEKLAEIKVVYKNAEESERESAIKEVKQEMEVIKQEKLRKAQENLNVKKQQIQKEKGLLLNKIKAKDDEDEFDYIDMSDVNVENPTKKKNLKIEELEEITEQYEPLTGTAGDTVVKKFNFEDGAISPEKQFSDVVSNHSHASSVKQEALHERIEQIKRELMGIQGKTDFESPAKNQDLM